MKARRSKLASKLFKSERDGRKILRTIEEKNYTTIPEGIDYIPPREGEDLDSYMKVILGGKTYYLRQL